jgi:hypothetical protein
MAWRIEVSDVGKGECAARQVEDRPAMQSFTQRFFLMKCTPKSIFLARAWHSAFLTL